MLSGPIELLLQQITAGMQDVVAAVERLNDTPGRVEISTPSAGYRRLLLAALFPFSRRPLVVFCPTIDVAEESASAARSWIGDRGSSARQIIVLPELGVEPMEYSQYSRPLAFARAHALDLLYAEQNPIVFTTVQAVIDPSLAPAEFQALATTLSVGDNIAPRVLAQRLVHMGYESVSSVTEMGQFGLRGNVFDLYSEPGEYPIRIVFEGNAISRMKLFDPVTQTSVEPVDTVRVLPPYPVPLDDASRRTFIRLAGERWQAEQIKGTRRTGQDVTLLEDLTDFGANANGRGANFFIYQYMEAHQLCAELARVLQSESIAVFAGTDPETELAVIFDSARELYDRTRQTGTIPASDALDGVAQAAADALSSFGRSVTIGAAALPGVLTLSSRELPPVTLSGSLSTYLATHAPDPVPIHVLSWNPEKAAQLMTDGSDDPGVLARTTIVKGTAPSGFATDRFVVLTDRELFPKSATSPKRTARFSQAISRLEDLHEGDYVVHRDYGIGLFRGITAMTVDKITRDYISLEYRDHSLLHVPVERLGYLEKYIGDRAEIALDEPGSRKWKRVRKEAAEDAKRVAHDLLATAAKRLTRDGYAFQPNPELEQPISEAFAYELTPDQAKAITDVLGDMEEGKPMDRLVCGDVGFGKTEVAIRAAARAVASGKQVAVVAPTTILALQHYRNLEERFAPVGYRVALFSRMAGSREISRDRKLLREGNVDIAVGTHKILNMADDFKDVGLLIVDEEQLFGVLDKEKIKRLKAEVDVLTLSATPIPRTLESSIVGIRDISVINTPPLGRYPIRTFLMPFDEDQLVRAVRAELERHGQVYFVHNRIVDIDSRLSVLSRLFPDARLAVAHGQIRSEMLEQVMLDFYEGRYDILLSTTIIEAGLDYPNVNTVIVDEAERLGLAQLYQLRGRVGRAQRHAYAYLFHSRGLPRESVAYRRLEAITSAVDFGAGLQVALKDLELRGAGDVLGIKQSGRFSDVGYHSFLSMVEEEILRERGQYTEPAPRPILILNLSAFIPDSYVPDSGERLTLYNAIERATEVDVGSLEARTEDRYGRLPQEVRAVFDLKRLELALMPKGVVSVKQTGHTLVLDCVNEDAASRFLRTHAGHTRGSRTVRDSVIIPMEAGEQPLTFLFRLLSGPEAVH